MISNKEVTKALNSNTKKIECLDELYSTISTDLSIEKFNGEDDISFKCRLVYSALGKWIMSLFLDRDYEDDWINQVFKSHVTNSAINILESYKKIDKDLCDYFKDDDERKIVNLIENVYVRVGYIISGEYSYKYQSKEACLGLTNNYLIINLETNVKKMIGLGLWNTIASSSFINLNDYMVINVDAKTYAKNLISQLTYNIFDSNFGKIEIYNIVKNKWDYYNEKETSNYDYYVIKVDDGMDYQILKKIDGKLYCASLPIIYNKTYNDFNFNHEIWRVILGICALNNSPVKCNISKYYDSALLIKFGGYILPSIEESLLRCMTWPMNNCLNINEFITDYSMKQSLIELLNRLSILIIEEN